MSGALNLNRLARDLGGEVSGGQVLAPGPNHGKADRSLAVRLDPGAPEGFVVHSFAEDDPLACRDHVRALAGLPGWQPSEGRGERSGAERMSERAGAPKPFTDRPLLQAGYSLSATYDYRSDKGAVLYQVLRYEHPEKGKTFRQRRPDGLGGWFGEAGDDRVLYRSADRLKVAHSTVWITEGEKDADRLASAGLTATTAASGKWTESMVSDLAGYDCFILEDNDEPGRRKASKLAEMLKPAAGAVHIVRIPGLAEGEDVSDWLDAGGDVARLKSFAAAPTANDNRANAEPEPVRPFVRPFVWRDPASMPRRQWVYGRHLIRKFVSATFAPGGVGKSALELAEAMAMASGKPLLGVKPRQRLRVGYWNGEDPFEETERRAAAAALLHDLTADDLEGWLHLGSGREDEVIIAKQTPSGATILAPNVEGLVATIRDLKLDVVIIDPFVSSHRVTENDNPAIDLVAKQWGKIADMTNTAIELVHHTRKTNGAETTVEDGRGAVALLAAARSARVLNAMSKDERERAGVKATEAYFRVENGKANLAPPSEGADWYQVASVDLGNADAFEPSDNVGAVRSWQWPDPFDGVKATDLLAVQRRIDGGLWRESIQAKDWVGYAIAEVLDLDLDLKADKQKVKGLLATWINTGALARTKAKDDSRQERPVVTVGRWAEVV